MFIPLLAVHDGDKVGFTSISSTVATIIDTDYHRDELTHALRSGRFYVADTVSNEGTGIFVASGGVVTQTIHGKLEVNCSAGVLENRAEKGEGGEFVPIVAGAKLALKPHNDTEDRTSLVQVQEETGVVAVKDGVLAAAGESVAPAADAKYQVLAEVLVAARATEPTSITDVRVRP